MILASQESHQDQQTLSYSQHHHHRTPFPADSFNFISGKSQTQAPNSGPDNHSVLSHVPKLLPDLRLSSEPSDLTEIAKAAAAAVATATATRPGPDPERDLFPASSEPTEPEEVQVQLGYSPLTGGNYQFETPSLQQTQSIVPTSSSTPDLIFESSASMSNSGSISPGQPGYRDGKFLTACLVRFGFCLYVAFSYSHLFWLSNFATDFSPHWDQVKGEYDGFPAGAHGVNGGNSHAQSSSHVSGSASLYGGFHPLEQHAQQQHLLHRASISGPVPGSSYPGEVESMGAPAPPRAPGLAAWETASGAARPHTADGMFGQSGYPGGVPSEAGDTSSVVGGGSVSGSRPFTPSTPGFPSDPYSFQRRFSMPSTSDVNGGQIFSYMPPVDDGMIAGGNGLPYASGYSSHLMGGLGGFNSAAGKKRPRRRYDEIERLYPCKWPGCTKSYGTLNHLNAHVAMQKHGPKRSPSEFKDMRKAWRKQKKEEEQRRQARQVAMTEHALARGELVRPGVAAPAYRHSASLPMGGHGLVPSVAAPAAPIGGPSVGLPAQLSRYSMSSVAATPPSSSEPFGYALPQGMVAASAHGQQQVPHLESSASSYDARPYSSSGQSQVGSGSYPQGGLGAYLMAHRGSI